MLSGLIASALSPPGNVRPAGGRIICLPFICPVTFSDSSSPYLCTTLVTMKRALTLLFLLLGAAGGFAAGEASREETLSLFENRKISIQVPQLHTYNAHKDETGIATVRIADPKEKVSLQLTFLPDPEDRFSKSRARREQMFEVFQEYVGSSKEQAMQFEELEPRTGAGTYCVFTDKALIGKESLPPNEYLHLTGGVKAWPGVVAIFRLFSNDTTSPEYTALMKVVRESVEERLVPLR